MDPLVLYTPHARKLYEKFKDRRVGLLLHGDNELDFKIELDHDPRNRDQLHLVDVKMVGWLADQGVDGDMGMTKNAIGRFIAQKVHHLRSAAFEDFDFIDIEARDVTNTKTLKNGV